MRRLSIVFLFIISISIALYACGGDDSSDTSGSLKETSRIVGTIEELVMTSVRDNNPSMLVEIKDLFSFIVEANAQDGELCGIEVTAFQNGVAVATGETNCDGLFELNDVPEGPTTIVFENELFSDSGFLDVPAGGTLNIKVSLDGDEETEVTINEIKVTTGPVECEDGVLTIGNDDINELNIIGNGGSCVEIIGSCDASIIAQNINLKECNVCINADNGAFVNVAAGQKFDCDAEEVGVNSNGDSDVIISGDKCTIESGDFQIVEDEGGIVDTENCEEVDLEGPDDGEEGEGDDGDEDENNEDEENENEGDEDDETPGKKNGACEFDCVNNDCELFCTEDIPGECVNSCSNSDNISSCVEQCADLECGRGACKEFCAEEGESVCEVVEKEVCELECEGECEEECVKFRKEEVLNGDCFEGCLLSECGELEGEQRESCFDEIEGPCKEECTVLVETDDCIEFELVGCECEEVCEIQEVEECDEVCEVEGISCRFECEEIDI